MFDYDAIIIGGGPAGLTAGIYLARARLRVLLLEREAFGGQVKNVEWIENYPGFAEGVSGPRLASEMINQAMKWGVQLELREVFEVESFSSCKSVMCTGGKGYTAAVVIVAGGSRPKKLGAPGEDRFLGKGVIHCALCDGDQFREHVVAVCGGGDAGATEAIYLTKLASKVILIEAQPSLTATAVLQERAYANPKLEIQCGEQVVQIRGDERVRAIDVVNVTKGTKKTLNVDGVLVHVGIEPSTGYLQGVLPLDEQGQIMVNNRLETKVAGIIAAGDVRSGSPRQVAAAVGDGATAAIAALRLLQVSARGDQMPIQTGLKKC